jgi:hypothetical protein
MALFALDIVLWLLGVRGHIPRFDEFRPVPATPVPGASGAVLRMLAAVIVGLGLLSLAVWCAVWLALRLL